MSAVLFRREAMRARQSQWLGSIRIARPPSFRWITVAAGFFALALAAFAGWGEIQRKSTVAGILVPEGGLLQVAAPQAGVLAQWYVREGDSVEKGQVLARIRNERHTDSGETGSLAREAIARRRASIESELRLIGQDSKRREQATADRIRSLELEAGQVGAELRNLDERIAAARDNQRRFQELMASGFVSPVHARQKEDDLLELLGRQGATRRGLQSIDRELVSLRADLAGRGTTHAAAREPLQRALAALEQELAELEARQGAHVLAPAAGTVGSIARHAGQSLAPGQTMLTLATGGDDEGAPPSNTNRARAAKPELQAHLFAPMRRAGFVRTGQQVWLRYDAYPFQKFGMAEGVVAHVSDSPLAPEDLPVGQGGALLAANQATEPLLRVIVRLRRQDVTAFGQRWPLKASATLQADIVQERRAIWEWIFEPLFAAKERARLSS